MKKELILTKIAISGSEQIVTEAENFIFVCAHKTPRGTFQVESTFQGDAEHLVACFGSLFKKDPGLEAIVAAAIDHNRRN